MELGAILEAFGESDFEETLEDFGSNLEDRLGGITEDIATRECDVSHVVESTHHTVVGTSLSCPGQHGDIITLVAPEISKFTLMTYQSIPVPPATIGLSYLIGDAASSAATEWQMHNL